jgi:Glycosyl hydrolases family 11
MPSASNTGADPEPSTTAAEPAPTTELDCDAAVPSGGTAHPSNNASGKSGSLDWTIWSNGNGGSITTYDVPAFSASWKESGDLLARLGLQWDKSKTYDQYGTITAQFAAKKTGSAGQYSYIGIYGWSVTPCVEFYIVEDSYNMMPVNPGSTSGTFNTATDIDGSAYVMYSRNTQGTGGSKCQGVNDWVQYYSIRKSARDCGIISVSEHFDAWKNNGWELGKMDQVQLLIEVGGGTGSIDFTTANITTTE